MDCLSIRAGSNPVITARKFGLLQMRVFEIQECASGKRVASKTAKQGSIPCTPAQCRTGTLARLKRILLRRIHSLGLSCYYQKKCLHAAQILSAIRPISGMPLRGVLNLDLNLNLVK